MSSEGASEGGQGRDNIVRLFLCHTGTISDVNVLTSDFGLQVQRKVIVCGDGTCGVLRLHAFAGTFDRSTVDLEQAKPGC